MEQFPRINSLVSLKEKHLVLEQLAKPLSVSGLEGLPLEQLVQQIVENEEQFVLLVLNPLVTFIDQITTQRNILDIQQMEDMFPNIEALFELHRELVQDLQRLQTTNDNPELLTTEIGKTFGSFAPYFKQYGVFFDGYEDAVKNYLRFASKSMSFRRVVKEMYLIIGIRPVDLMEIIFDRIPQYMTFLTVLETKAVTAEAKTAVSKASTNLLSSLETIAYRSREKNAREAVVYIQQHICKNKAALVDPSRFVIKQEEIALSDVAVLAVLMNDMLLVVGGKTFIQILRLRTMTIEEMEDKLSFRINDSNLNEKFQFQCKSPNSSASWIQEIKLAVDNEKQSLIGAHISDEYFRKMILKEVPQLPLVDPDLVVASIKAFEESKNQDQVWISDSFRSSLHRYSMRNSETPTLPNIVQRKIAEETKQAPNIDELHFTEDEIDALLRSSATVYSESGRMAVSHAGVSPKVSVVNE
jgi:hypothetical protein